MKVNGDLLGILQKLGKKLTLEQHEGEDLNFWANCSSKVKYILMQNTMPCTYFFLHWVQCFVF